MNIENGIHRKGSNSGLRVQILCFVCFVCNVIRFIDNFLEKKFLCLIILKYWHSFRLDSIFKYSYWVGLLKLYDTLNSNSSKQAISTHIFLLLHGFMSYIHILGH